MSATADLNGKVVLITGAGGGLGEADTRAAAASGATVVATDLAAPLALRDLGAEHLLLAHDVSDRAAWDLVVEEAVRRFGRIDGLVNNAGVCRYAPFAESTPALFEELLGVNLWGAIHGMQAVLPHMPAGGSIVNIASVAGLSGWPNATAYSASKFALRGLTRSAAVELGRDGVRVNCVCPGAAETPMLSADARAGRGPVAALPIGRPGRPEEVSAMVMFLLGDGAGYCTGQDFVVDGGMKA